jgi:hypothetical protein
MDVAGFRRAACHRAVRDAVMVVEDDPSRDDRARAGAGCDRQWD